MEEIEGEDDEGCETYTLSFAVLLTFKCMENFFMFGIYIFLFYYLLDVFLYHVK